jgi:hypothetical protein
VTRGVLIQNRPVRWALVFLFWTLIGLSFASQFYLASYKAGRPVTWGQAVGWSLGDWYVWMVMSLPIVQLARRFRFDDAKWGRNVAIHLAASAICSLGYMALRAGVGQAQSRWGGTPVSFAETFNPLLVKTFHLNRGTGEASRAGQAADASDAAQSALSVQFASRDFRPGAQRCRPGGPDDHASQ